MTRQRYFPGIVAAVALIAALLGTSCSRENPPSPPQSTASAGALTLGTRPPDFTLPPYFGGDPISLSSQIDGQHFVAVIWHSPACPCAGNCAAAIARDLTPEKYPDLRIVGIISDKFWDYDWFREDLKKQVDTGAVHFPLLHDKDFHVREQYGALRTPTVWLLDKEGIIRFWGAPENTLVPEGENYKFLLKEALDDLRAGKPVRTPTFEPIGCKIET